MTLTQEHVDQIRRAHKIIMDEIDKIPECDIPPCYRVHRLAELCPEACAAHQAFLANRRAAGENIDPQTCEWQFSYLDSMDPYAITGECGSVGRGYIVWDENSDGYIEARDLSKEKHDALMKRIEGETKPQSSLDVSTGRDLAARIRAGMKGWSQVSFEEYSKEIESN